ncbi:MAG: dicarboxylate/amino acid:cation symporter [Caulobacterales bacterium]|jgi:aerobic C4-dicarboxylate transport protein
MGVLRHFRQLWVQVLVGVALGVAVGALWPHFGAALKPLGDAFIKLIKMAVAPVIFCTVAAGIARMGDLKAFGRLGLRTLLYFEVVSTFALAVGLVVGTLIHPGAGFNIDPASLDPRVGAGYAAKAAHGQGVVGYLMNLIPDTFLGAFAGGDLLQVLVVAILTGFACTGLGGFGARAAGVLEDIAQLFFGIIGVIVRLAPVGAFGAMAFTIGKFGLGSLLSLGAIVGTFYLTSVLFVLVVLGTIAWACGFSILKFLAYIRDELLIVLGASSSEAALPLIMAKLQRLGAGKTTVGLVIPTGYSFNLDGTNIYMTLATLFLAQATNTPLSLGQEATLLGVAMLTSKGASGVAGAGFITLAATLAVIPDLPIAALALLVGVDRFMSECRALTNFVGNGVGTLVIARWEGDLDMAQLRAELDRGPGDEVALLDTVEAR